MKVYASSFRLCARPERYSRLFGESLRVAVIPNALDFSSDEAWRRKWLKRELDDLQALGLQPDELDLRDFFGDPLSLRQDLSAFNGVWVIGGNVFLLRRAMRQSGFDEFIWRQRTHSQGFVYGGYSAGSCVLAPSLHGLEIVDPPTQLASGYDPSVCWDGLGILSYSVAPHFDSDHSEAEQIKLVVDYFKAQGIPYRTLRDGEAIIVDPVLAS